MKALIAFGGKRMSNWNWMASLEIELLYEGYLERQVWNKRGNSAFQK